MIVIANRTCFQRETSSRPSSDPLVPWTLTFAERRKKIDKEAEEIAQEWADLAADENFTEEERSASEGNIGSSNNEMNARYETGVVLP